MIAATEARLPAALPPVARFGFDDGWLLLKPTFLNLQGPVLLVDQIHIGTPITHGLEPFGSRDPRLRLPVCRIRVVICGSGVTLWTTRDRQRCLIAAHWFEAPDVPTICWGSAEMVLLVGDTYAVQTSWCALWTCLIGKARIERRHAADR